MTRRISDRAVERLKAVSRLPELAGTGYRLIEPIGRGGMGVVYRAEDTKLGRQVALKVLYAADESGELASRLVREAQVLARLEHPGIVPVHDVGVLEDGRLFYTMKLVRGHSLDEYLRAAHSLAERLRVFVRVCEAVALAHDRGVLHRDLKPANIMVGAFGEVLVMDWGVAKIVAGDPERPEATAGAPGGGPPETAGSTAAVGGNRSEAAGLRAGRGGAPATADAPTPLTSAGTILGTPGYMAPEQARGEMESLDARADIFSLGAVLSAMLAHDEVASEATTMTLPEGDLPPPEEIPPGLPKRLTAIVAKAKAPERGGRYASLQELIGDVESFLDGDAVSALPESPWTKVGRFLSRHRVAVILILVYVVVRTLVLLYGGR